MHRAHVSDSCLLNFRQYCLTLSSPELKFQMNFPNRFLAGVCLQQLFLNFLCTVFSKLLTRILKDAKVFLF